jgi:hypothetical protein
MLMPMRAASGVGHREEGPDQVERRLPGAEVPVQRLAFRVQVEVLGEPAQVARRAQAAQHLDEVDVVIGHHVETGIEIAAACVAPGGGTAAGNRGRLDHGHREPALGELMASDQTGNAGAQDDDMRSGDHDSRAPAEYTGAARQQHGQCCRP